MTKKTVGAYVSPDMLVQYGPKLANGIVFEIKTSISENEEYAIRELKELKKYDEDLEGWETENKLVDNQSLVLICGVIDSKRILSLYSLLNTSKELVLEKLFSIWEMMGPLSSPKFGQGDVIIFRGILGKTGFEALDIAVREPNQLVIPTKDLGVQLDNLKFTRKEPPTEYMIDVLWQTVFPILPSFKFGKTFQVTLEEITQTTHDYYPPWAGIPNEPSQVRKRWIHKSMDALCEINLVRIINDNPPNYEIFYDKQMPKNFKNHIIDLLCQKEMSGRRSLEAEKSLRLDEFSANNQE